MNNSKEIIKYNKLIAHDKWSITLTLKPIYTDQLTHVEQWEVAIPLLIDLIPQLGECIISIELTQKRNLHFHLYCVTTNKLTIKSMRIIIDFLLNDSIFGFYYLRPIYDLEGWMQYINKDQYFVERYKYAFSLC